MELEKIREQKKRMEEEFKRINNMHEDTESELVRMANDLQALNFSPGHQSEPTTPPEYRDQGYSSIFTNRNRFSSASLTSPPGLNRLSRSGSQLTSPPPETVQNGDSDKLPSKSVPASRRGSSDKFAQFLPESGIIGQRSLVKCVMATICLQYFVLSYRPIPLFVFHIFSTSELFIICMSNFVGANS
jgi:hypothetical protein